MFFQNLNTSKTIKKILLTLVAVLSITTILSTSVEAKSATKINKTKVTVCTGKDYTLKVYNANKKVKWYTSNKNIVSIAKKSGKKSENCIIKTGKKKGTVTITAKVGSKKYTTKVTVAAHKYAKPSYKWNKDYSKCTATKECTRCHKKLTQTVKASKKTTQKATCTEKGKRTYTAKFTKYDFGKKTKNVSIKALGHAFDKVSYKWNASYSACTAKAVCSRCNASVSEKATVTSKVTKQATKSATGVRTHTATFKNKDFATQTKDITIPKVVYLDKTSITIKYGQPATIKVVNGTLGESAGPNAVCSSYKDLVKFDGGECDTTNAYDEDDDEFFEKSNVTYKKSKDMTSITFYAIKEASDKTYTVSLLLSNGQTLKCNVTTEFVPGEYNFGMVSSSYQDTTNQRYYNAYGNNKGFSEKGYYDYVVTCNTKAEYDAAYNFYNNQKDKYGRKCNLELKSADINNACSERSLWKATNSSVKEDMISEGYDPNNIDDIYLYAELHPAYGRMVFGNLYDTQGNFNINITSQSQVDAIVADWANEYNNGILPSWYYSTAFSDWAEWSGRDIGKYTTYIATDEYTGYVTPPALPDNFRE